MKSLDQIEAAHPDPVCHSRISNSGSFYLTKNLSVLSGDGITITVNGVSLDLNDSRFHPPPVPRLEPGILLINGLRKRDNPERTHSGSVTNHRWNLWRARVYDGIFYSRRAVCKHPRSSVSVSGCLNSGISLARGFDFG